MKAHELAEKLLKLPNYEITILDGNNGCGEPRTINLSPHVDFDDGLEKMDRYDIDTRDPFPIIVMGYGCY